MLVTHLSYPSLDTKMSKPVVLAIGYFDGVHLGHQKVIHTAQQMARKLGYSLAVMTFHPHPKEVLQKDVSLRYLTPLNAKLNLFEQLGVERTFVMKFDWKLAGLSAEAFVRNILLPLQVKGIVTGFNFRFGKNQMGSTEDLKRLGQGHFETEVVHAVEKNRHPISSTWIRQLLAQGDIALVNQLLARYYRFQGRVEEGDQRGRLIGFPTANIDVYDPYCLPKKGVYVVQADWEHRPFEYTRAYGMMNIGIRPTFKGDHSPEKVEVHLFEQDKDLNLYGKEISIEVMHYLRAEQKFPSIDALVQQIKIDQQQAEKWLNASGLFT